jgi:DNA-binding transcriptional LysR family regulator
MDRLTGLKLFVRVVDTGSFSKAACDLNLTQPTVTKHIAAIEQRLAVRLLNRNSRHIGLTEIGSLYYEKCKVVLQDLEAAESIVEQNFGDIRGSMRIGTSMAFGRQVIAPLLIGFLGEYPDLKVDLSCDEQYVDVIGQGLDVAIRLGKLADSALGRCYLGKNPWVMVASKGYLARYGSPQEPSDLVHHRCLIDSAVHGDEVWHLQTPQGCNADVRVSGPLRSNNLSALLTAVSAGMGIAILPTYVAAGELAAGRVRCIMTDHLLPVQEINAVLPSPRFVPGKISALLSFFQRRFQGEWWHCLPA